MAKLSSAERDALPDSAFAYIDEKGERHFPIHNKAHVVAALRLGPRSPMWSKAKGKVMAAAKKYGVGAADTDRSLESLYPEVRFISDKPELRAAEDGPQHIIGYAAVFKSTSRKLGNFHEQVMPTAFDAALRAIEDRSHKDVPMNVVCRYNHKDDMLLGTTHAGTLKLSKDERGLKYDVIPPECRADVMEYVGRGDVRYSSFAFRVPVPGEDDSWGESEHGLPLRQLHSVELVDVAPVLDPAYFATSASGRGMNGAIESLASWVDGDPEEIRSILEAGQASKLFRNSRRTGTQVIPKLDAESASNREESRVLDDPAVALRSSKFTSEPVMGESEVPEEERYIRDEDEIRAAVKPRTPDKLCMRYHHGEPCVRPTGHGPFSGTMPESHDHDDPDNPDDHRGLCWGRHDGLPCNQHAGHEGSHAPMPVASRDGEVEGEQPEQRSEETPEPATLTAPEAMAKMLARKKNLTALPD
jgi:HK97 family phage prohead protease